MSGHSKWSTIKRKKAAVDAKRGKLFTRILREITVSARLGGGDPDANPRLRAAIQEARNNNVPADKIDRAVAKGTGELGGEAMAQVIYEGYAPGGVAVMVETMTDNKNRTVGEVRHVFSKHGGNLGENGCVSYLFEQQGYFLLEPEAMDEEDFMELAVELEVDDIATDDSGFEIFTTPDRFVEVKEALKEREVPVATAEVAMIPSTWVDLAEDQMPQAVRFVEALEELDDVQNVWTNVDSSAFEDAEA